MANSNKNKIDSVKLTELNLKEVAEINGGSHVIPCDLDGDPCSAHESDNPGGITISPVLH